MKKPLHIKKDIKAITNALVFAGVSKNVAKALACIMLSKEILSKDIEGITGLRQPEVSLAVQELRRMGWAAKRDIKKAGKGRPIHAYRLSKPFSKIQSLDITPRDSSMILTSTQPGGGPSADTSSISP